MTRWLAERAADAPHNFSHLLRLAEAERAWAVGAYRAAELAFDAARREAARRQQPWHRALIAERAAGFYLARGVEHVGYDLLAQARHEYLAWARRRKPPSWTGRFLRCDPDPTRPPRTAPASPLTLRMAAPPLRPGPLICSGFWLRRRR